MTITLPIFMEDKNADKRISRDEFKDSVNCFAQTHSRKELKKVLVDDFGVKLTKRDLKNLQNEKYNSSLLDYLFNLAAPKAASATSETSLGYTISEFKEKGIPVSWLGFMFNSTRDDTYTQQNKEAVERLKDTVKN